MKSTPKIDIDKHYLRKHFHLVLPSIMALKRDVHPPKGQLEYMKRDCFLYNNQIQIGEKGEMWKKRIKYFDN